MRRYEYRDARHPHHLTSISVQELDLAAYGGAPEIIHLGAWKYDELGRGIFSTHPDDADKVTLSYGEGYTDVTDAFGRTSRYSTEIRAGILLVTEVRGPGCGVCGPGDVRYRYNDRLQITDVIMRSGISNHYVYDAHGRLSQNMQSVPGGEKTWKTRFAYEQNSPEATRIERPSVNPRDVHSFDFAYTRDGQIRAVTERGFSPTHDGNFAAIERTMRVEYDRAGRMIAIDGFRDDAADITYFEYDTAQRLVALIDADGSEHRILAHDEVGRPLRIRRTGFSDVELRYTPTGRVTMLIEHRTSGERIRRLDYDAVGRIRSIAHPDGSTREFGRDRAGRINRRTNGNSGFTQATLFDADGQLSKRALLNRAGEISSVLHLAYDTQRRLIEVRDGAGPPLRQLVYTDDDTRADRVIDALGRETAFAYDRIGRLTNMVSADGSGIGFAYTERGAIASVTAPNGTQTRYEYDDFGRRVREHSADRGTIHYDHDGAGNFARKTDARGSTTTFRYTPGNLLESVATGEETTRFDYASGRLMRASGPWGEESYEYDHDGNLSTRSRIVAGRTFSTSYRYNANGALMKRKLASGDWLKYDYDDKSVLKKVSLDKMLRSVAIVAAAEKDQGGLAALGDIRFGNALMQATRLDRRGRLHRRSIQGIESTRYGYDEANRLVRISEGERHQVYEYDAANRLVAANSPRYTIHYAYDLNGNRVSTRSDDHLQRSNVEYEYASDSNRLLSAQGIGVSSSQVSYDPAGNLLQISNRRYEYDGSGRAIRLYVADQLAAEYTYNVWGERIRKIVHTPRGKRTTLYLYEQHRLIAETDNVGAITREYVYVDHHPVALLERGVLYWIHTDHLGAPVAVTDTKRRVVWRAGYEPFGLAGIEEDPDGDGKTLELHLRFPGQYADIESGTYYNMMRDYDPALGRYLTPDPLGVLAGTNSYAYVHNNPTNSFDSLGLYDEMIHYYMTYFLGIVAGLPQDIARTIAVAAQYIDENPLTAPVNNLIDANERALPLYHFVMDQQGPLYGDATTDLLDRFYNPSSLQLNHLFASTDAATLQRLWREVNPGANACPSPWVINDARYQLFGEYLHSFQDTFAHRDLLNVPYGVHANADNRPIAFYGGHTGLGTLNPLAYEPPDHTYNQDLADSPSQCLTNGSGVLPGLSERACTDQGGYYIPTETNEWKYNELRTLRMQHEVFRMFGNNFSDEIATNRRLYAENNIPVPIVSWQDLAGRAWNDQNPESNARVGLDQTYDHWRTSQGLSELNTVLQRFNASDEENRLEILNAWLDDMKFATLAGSPIEIEPWDRLDDTAAAARWDNIGWIPAGSLSHVLLPRDEECQQIRNVPGNCDDQPRR